MSTQTVYVTVNQYTQETVNAGASFGTNHNVRALEMGSLNTLWTAALSGPGARMVLTPDLATLYVAEATLAINQGVPNRTRIFVVNTATQAQTSVWTLPIFKEGATPAGAAITSSLCLSPDGSEIWVPYSRIAITPASDAVFETLTPPSGQHFWASIERFSTLDGSHLGSLSGRFYATDLSHLAGPTPYSAASYLISDGNLKESPIGRRLGVSADGGFLFATGAVPTVYTQTYYPFGTVHDYTTVILKYPILAPVPATETAPALPYRLDTPTTLLCGNVPPNTDPSTVSGASGVSSFLLSPDGATVFTAPNFIKACDATTGNVIAKGNTSDASAHSGMYQFQRVALDADAGKFYSTYGGQNTAQNNFRQFDAASIATAPALYNTFQDVIHDLDVYAGVLFATAPILTTGGDPQVNKVLLKLSSGTLTRLTLPYSPWCVLCSSGVVAGGGGTDADAAGMQVTWDAHRQPRAITGSSGIQFLASADNGHTFTPYAACATGKNPSLLISPRSNLVRVIFDNSGLSVLDAAQDGERSDWGTSAAITGGVSGTFPVCAKHPTDPARVLMMYLDSGTLKSAISYDGGAPGSWSALGTVDSSLDFTKSGRAGLCWFGEMPCVVYASGSNLLARTSADGGKTWGAAVTIASAGPYHGVSAASGQGTVVVCASDASAPHLWVSPDLGATWSAGNAPPSPTGPAALALDPRSGRLWYGTALKSDNWGVTWEAP